MNTLTKKPEFKIEVKCHTISTGVGYHIYLYKDGNLIACYPFRDSIEEVGDIVMKLEAFTKYYIEDND